MSREKFTLVLFKVNLSQNFKVCVSNYHKVIFHSVTDSDLKGKATLTLLSWSVSLYLYQDKEYNLTTA